MELGSAHGGSRPALVGIEIPRPLRVAPVIRKRVVEAAEVRIGERTKGNIGRVSHDRTSRERIAHHGNSVGGRIVERRIDEEAVVANRELRTESRVPQVAGVHGIVRAIRRTYIGLTRQRVGIVRGKGIGGLARGHIPLWSACGNSRDANVHIAI